MNSAPEERWHVAPFLYRYSEVLKVLQIFELVVMLVQLCYARHSYRFITSDKEKHSIL